MKYCKHLEFSDLYIFFPFSAYVSCEFRSPSKPHVRCTVGLTVASGLDLRKDHQKTWKGIVGLIPPDLHHLTTHPEWVKPLSSLPLSPEENCPDTPESSLTSTTLIVLMHQRRTNERTTSWKQELASYRADKLGSYPCLAFAADVHPAPGGQALDMKTSKIYLVAVFPSQFFLLFIWRIQWRRY